MDPRAEQIHDTYHTVFLLQQKLVRDVIPAIIDYAELYECATSEIKFHPTLRISQSQAPKQLMTCGIARPSARVLRPVKSIVFTIRSHDQGFASDRDGGSWTWFTAQKLFPTDNTNDQAVSENSSAPMQGEHREVFRNPIASRQWCTHEVEWRAHSEDPAEAEWVSSLREGDVFAIHAWARFPAWVNHISDVTVRVYSVAVA